MMVFSGVARIAGSRTRSAAATETSFVDESCPDQQLVTTRDSMAVLLKTVNISSAGFASAEEFLASEHARQPACVLLDVRLPGINRIELLARLNEVGSKHVVVMITGHGDVPMAVTAMRAGAFHFAEKPFDPDAFVGIVADAPLRLDKLADSLEHSQQDASR